jgi:hypothetical protein
MIFLQKKLINVWKDYLVVKYFSLKRLLEFKVILFVRKRVSFYLFDTSRKMNNNIKVIRKNPMINFKKFAQDPRGQESWELARRRFVSDLIIFKLYSLVVEQSNY